MKRILVACGTGVVTSTVAVNKIKEAMKARGLNIDKDYSIIQCKIAEIPSKADMADFMVTTAQAPKNVSIPGLNGLPLLTGIKVNDLYEEIAKMIKE